MKRYTLFCFFTSVMLLSFVALAETGIITLADAEAVAIGQKIWFNETGGKIEHLIAWNEGEAFLSLGIGHFIWYPEGYEGPFAESFPDLLAVLQNDSVPFPDWLHGTSDCPWATREEFLQNRQSVRIADLQALLSTTIPQQTRFLVQRLEAALPKMLESMPTEEQRTHIREQFTRVAQAPGGLYALIDYVNFKGEGTSPTERYQELGWGLLQVLELMEKNAPDAVAAFADAAETVLHRRVQHAPPERRESQWLPGWKNRIQSYRKEEVH
jgi:hypothetical protein